MNAEDKALLETKLLMMNMDEDDQIGVGPGVVDSVLSAPAFVLPAPPSVEELEAALYIGSNPASMSSDQCLRALLLQNSVMLREFIWRKKYTAEISTRSSSLHSSAPSSAGSSNVSSPTLHRAAPPANFECPVCPRKYNEKDFDRHVFKWIGRESIPFKHGSCPGIRDPNDPLLQRFVGTHAQRVVGLVTDIRAILHPGAYDSMSPTGSGRHVNVTARISELRIPL